MDEQKRKTYLKRLLNGLAHIQKQLNTRRYKKCAHVEERLATLRQRRPAKASVGLQMSGEDGVTELSFRVNRHKLAAAQELEDILGRLATADEAIAVALA